MPTAPPHRYPWPPRLGCLIASQFASALADNALLIVAILLLEQRNLPGWWAPVLKLGFTVSYVALAPFVGAFADALPKARVMALMNAVKVLGVVSLLLGAHPVLGMAIVGIGAAAYAPAKFGLLTELVPAQRLVAANAWLEVSVVCAALLGVVLGGLLVSPWLLQSAFAQALQGFPAVAFAHWLVRCRRRGCRPLAHAPGPAAAPVRRGRRAQPRCARQRRALRAARHSPGGHAA